MRRIAVSSGAMRSSVQPLRVALDQPSSSSALSAVACASARVNVGGVALEDVVERPAGQVVLVEGEDGRRAAAARDSYARDMYEPERVSTLTRSPMFTNSGTFTIGARSPAWPACCRRRTRCRRGRRARCA